MGDRWRWPGWSAPSSSATPTSGAELERVAALVANSPCAGAHLALVGDKQLLFHPSGAGYHRAMQVLLPAAIAELEGATTSAAELPRTLSA